MRIPLPAAGLLTLLLLAGSAPGQDGEPAPAPSDPPPATAAPAPKKPVLPPPPATLAEAWKRLERLRHLPLGGPGSLVRRREKVRAIAAAALALPEAGTAAGEDLFRLADLAGDADRFDEAVAFAAKYLAAEGEHPSEGKARAVMVRALAESGRFEEMARALEAYRKALPDAEGIPAVERAAADSLVRAGRHEEGLALYRQGLARAARVHPRSVPGIAQAGAELLLALGRTDEARSLLEGAKKGAEPAVAARVDSLLLRLDMVGRTFPSLPKPRWIGGEAPAEGALKGRVGVHVAFAWWMETRLDDLALWAAAAERLGPKGLSVLPLTRTNNWDPASGRFARGGRPSEKEIPDIEAAVRGAGWKAPFAVAVGGETFAALQVRGLPMEIVQDREGIVRFVRVGGEVGPALTMIAVERLLAAE